MKSVRLIGVFLLGWALFCVPLRAEEEKTFTVCWWNVENFGVSDRFIDGRHVMAVMKPAAEIDAVVAILRKIQPDVLGVAEIMCDPGDRNLKLFREVLKQGGLDYPAMATVRGHDTRIQLVLLSRFPILSTEELNKDRFPVTLVNRQTKESREARFLVNRGFVSAEVEVAPGQKLRVMLAHLKSKKDSKSDFDIVGEEPDETGDAVVRRKEAGALRGHVDAFLKWSPGDDLLVMGDLNDTEGGGSLGALLGRKGEEAPLWALPLADWKGENWTEMVYPQRDRERIDYMLASPSLRQRFEAAGSFVYRGRPEEGPKFDTLTASDHRPLVAKFRVSATAAP